MHRVAQSLRSLQSLVEDLTRQFEVLREPVPERSASLFLSLTETNTLDASVDGFLETLAGIPMRPHSPFRVAADVLRRAVIDFVTASAKHQQAVRDAVFRGYDGSEHEAAVSPESMAALKRGLADAKAGRISPRGPFAQYLDT